MRAWSGNHCHQNALAYLSLEALAARLAGFTNREIFRDGASLPSRKRTPASNAFNVAFVGLALGIGIRQPIGCVATRAVERNGGELPHSLASLNTEGAVAARDAPHASR
jgi:hypothetical protein